MLGKLIPCGGGDTIPLAGSKLLLGRRSSCDIKLDFPNVSSHHCELELIDGYWHIRDLGSSNGIKVNGERCESKCLMPGDDVTIARHMFRIEYLVSGNSPPPEPQNSFSQSLMEKAGLDVKRSRTATVPQGSLAPSTRVKQARRASSDDDFIMDWLNDE